MTPPAPRGEATGRAATRVVYVLGPPRSGTSMVMRMVNLLGAEVGDERRMLAPHEANPEGFWERRDVNEVNEAVLRFLGGSWHAAPPARSGWTAEPELDPLRDRARAILDELPAEGVVAFKDPRFSFTLPFWLELTPDAACVICLRHPADMGRSIARMVPDVLDEATGAEQWLRYTSSALRVTSGRPVLVVSYDAVLADVEGEARRLAAFLRFPADDERLARVRAAVSSGLRHHATAAGVRMPAVADLLHAALAATRALDGDDPRFAAVREAGGRLEELSEARPDGGDAGLWRRQTEILTRELAAVEARERELHSWASSREEGLAWHLRHRAELEERARRLETLVDEARAAAGAHEREAAATQARAADAEDLAERQRERADAAEALAATERARAEHAEATLRTIYDGRWWRLRDRLRRTSQ